MAAVGRQGVRCNPAALTCPPLASQLRAGRASIANQRHSHCQPAGGSAGKRCNPNNIHWRAYCEPAEGREDFCCSPSALPSLLAPNQL